VLLAFAMAALAGGRARVPMHAVFGLIDHQRRYHFVFVVTAGAYRILFERCGCLLGVGGPSVRFV